MNMKYIKQINMFLAFAMILGAVTLFAGSAKADPVIMGPGIPQNQVYPGYSGPVIMSAGVYSGPSTAPVIPDIYSMTPAVTYTQPVPYTQPQQGPYIMSSGTPNVTYTNQSNVTYLPPNNQTTAQAQSATTVKGTTIHAPAKNGIKTTTANATGVTANSTAPGICASDTVNYTLSYANTTTGTITNAMLIVTMPAEIDYKNATGSVNYNERNRTVTLFIGTLTKGQSGVVYLQGTANRMVNGTQTISTRVDFTFTKANGAAETNTSYVIHSGTNCGNALGANVLGSGFLPTSFGGWLLLAIILCAIVFIVRKYFERGGGHAHGHSMEHQAH